MRILAAQINPIVGDIDGNFEKIKAVLKRACQANAQVVVFPELALIGYPPEDLLLDPALILAVENGVEKLAPFTQGLFVALGTIRRNSHSREKPLYNSAAIFQDGSLLGFCDKQLLPTYDVFDERRFFAPGRDTFLWEYQNRKIAVTICEDIWAHATTSGEESYYDRDPIGKLRGKKIDLMLNLSASPYSFKRESFRKRVCQATAIALQAPVILCNQVGANDQLVFDGYSLYCNAKGEIESQAPGFCEVDFLIDLQARSLQPPLLEDPIEDLYHALVLGVRDYFYKQSFSQAIIGLSGGIDSALVACIAKDALGAENVLALSLPSRFSSDASYSDAKQLADYLGISLKKISIDSLFQSFLDELNPFFKEGQSDVTEENLQTRIRGMLLMAFSNKFNCLLLNTSNKSELAMGYSTLYGDMCGALGVLMDVTKRKVYQLSYYLNRKEEVIPRAILEKEPSAELRDGQLDRDSLPPYEILDCVIEGYIEEGLSVEETAERSGISASLVYQLIQTIHRMEYKRRQSPIALRVTKKSFSKGRSVPIVQKWK